MERMDPAIGKLPRHACHRRIIAPTHPRVVGIRRIAMVPVGEIRHHQPHFPDIAPRNHVPHLADHRIGAVAIVHRTNPARRPGDAHDLLALFDRHRHRLLAKHVEPGFQKGLGDIEMRRVRCRHGHQIDAILAPPLARQHLLPIGISPVRRDPQFLGIGPTPLGIGIQSARCQHEVPIRPRAHQMRRSDLAALAAADHAPIQSRHLRIQSRSDRRGSPWHHQSG